MKRLHLIIILLILAASVYYFFFVFGFRGLHNGKVIVRKYFCSDVCPQAGGYYTVYYGVKTKDECTQIGGISKIDPAWGGYIGCAPTEQ